MGNKNKSGIIMPPDKKVVNMRNEPQQADTPQNPDELSVKQKCINGLRDMAQQIEDGTISSPEFIIVLPKLSNGDLPMIYLGDPIPTLFLEGIIHKLSVKMAMGS